MSLLDRYIFIRFSANFAILFTLLFIFAAAVDVILNLDNFVEAARLSAGPKAGMAAVAGELIRLTADFQGPRLFQFYAYLQGLVAIGAMGFTLAQMHRHHELVAVMASGVSLYRVAVPFFIAVFGLSVLQLLNQELLLPRVAPLLLRSYGEIGEQGVDSFAVPFTPDSHGHLLQAPRFNPQAQTLIWPTVLERDDRGRTLRRITAEQATWSADRERWLLTKGRAMRPRLSDEPAADGTTVEKLDSYPSDLTPQVLLVRHYSQFAAMLSLGQISQMLQAPSLADREALLRYRYSRISSVLVNLLVLCLTLPCFLLRGPANLLHQSVLCAALALPASMGAAIGMMIDLPGISPALGVFLPPVVLGFLAMFPWTFFKT